MAQGATKNEQDAGDEDEDAVEEAAVPTER